MTEDEAAKVMSKLFDQIVEDAICGPAVPNKLTAIRYVRGRIEVVEIDDAGKIIEPPARCPKCGPFILCAEHMAMIA